MLEEEDEEVGHTNPWLLESDDELRRKDGRELLDEPPFVDVEVQAVSKRVAARMPKARLWDDRKRGVQNIVMHSTTFILTRQ